MQTAQSLLLCHPMAPGLGSASIGSGQVCSIDFLEWMVSSAAGENGFSESNLQVIALKIGLDQRPLNLVFFEIAESNFIDMLVAFSFPYHSQIRGLRLKTRMARFSISAKKNIRLENLCLFYLGVGAVAITATLTVTSG